MPINWQAVGPIVTSCAVLVALLPIYIASKARKAKARNLRIRIAVKLTKLKPTLLKVAIPDSTESIPEYVLLAKDYLEKITSELEALLKESEVLNPKEQVVLSQVVANLELMLPMFCAKTLPPTGAQSILMLIDRSISLMERHGMLAGEPFQPWKKP